MVRLASLLRIADGLDHDHGKKAEISSVKIVKGETIQEPGVPESFKILVNELQSLCLKVSVADDHDREIDLRDSDDEYPDSDDPVRAAARRRSQIIRMTPEETRL